MKISQATRHYLYNLVLALIPALVALGIILPGDVEVWFFLAAAILGLPAANLGRQYSGKHVEVVKKD